MVDYSSLSDEQLKNLYAQSTGPDYSKMSDEELKSSYLKARKAEAQQQEPDDHGLAERQKLSPIGKALSPITGYWPTQQRMSKEAQDLIASGVGNILNSGDLTTLQGTGLYDIGKGVGKVGLGALGYVMSPVSSALRSVVGQPIEDVTGIPRELTEFTAGLGMPGIGLAEAPAIAEGSLASKVLPKQVPQMLPKKAPVEEAISSLQQQGYTPFVPRTVSSENPVVQELGARGSQIPIAGQPVIKATQETMPQSLERTVQEISGKMGTESGPTTAGKIAKDLQTAAETESQQRQAQIDAAHQAELDRVENTRRARQAEIDRAEQQAESAARGRFGDVNPQDAGEDLLARTQQHHNELEGRKNAAYDQAANEPGIIGSETARNAPGNIRAGLREANVLNPRETMPDPTLMPRTNAMLRDIDNLADVPEGQIGVTLQDLEQMRKRLNRTARSATDDNDRWGALNILRRFDDWQESAMQTNFAGGRPEALDAFRNARSLNTELMNNFGYNRGTDAEKFIHRMVTEDVTPQEVLGKIVGSTPGKQGVSSRLHQQIMTATGNDPIAAQSIRGAYWNTLRQNPETIEPFLSESGRDMANRVFSQSDQAAARTYAAAREQATQERAITEQIAKDTTPKPPPKAEAGPMQQLSERVLGTGQQKSEEQLFRKIDDIARTGAKEDNETLRKLTRGLSDQARDNLGAQVINNLGISPKTKEFSISQFRNGWNSYSDEAKALLIRDPTHRKNLDDVATIGQRWNEIGSKFANVSKSGAQVSFFDIVKTLATGAIGSYAAFHPGQVAGLTALTASGYGGMKLLATPAGASSLAKFMKAADASAGKPTTLLKIAARNLANTAATMRSQ